MALMRPKPRSASGMRARPSSAANTGGCSAPRRARTWPRSRPKLNRSITLACNAVLHLPPADGTPPDILAFMQMAQDIATCIYYTGIDPFMKKAVYIAKNLRDRKMQRALLQFFKPENY